MPQNELGESIDNDVTFRQRKTREEVNCYERPGTVQNGQRLKETSWSTVRRLWVQMEHDEMNFLVR